MYIYTLYIYTHMPCLTDRPTDMSTWNMNKALLLLVGALSCVAMQEGDDYGPSPKVTDEVKLSTYPPTPPEGQKSESP